MLFTQLYLELEKCKSKPTTPASSAGYHPAGAYFSVILNGRFEPLALEQQNRIPPLFYKKNYLILKLLCLDYYIKIVHISLF